VTVTAEGGDVAAFGFYAGYEIFDHYDEGFAVFFADVVNRADIQGGGGLSFAAKTLECVAIYSEFCGQEFERDEAVEARVLRFIDHTPMPPAPRTSMTR
jgi:hypothetical protein